MKTPDSGLIESIARTMNISWEQAADILDQLERNSEPGCKFVDEQGQVIREPGIAITDAMSAPERRKGDTEQRPR